MDLMNLNLTHVFTDQGWRKPNLPPQSSAGGSTVVWDPGAAMSYDNVYKTWVEVVQAVSAMQGAVDIVVAQSAPPVIPAGNWDLRPPGVFGPVRLCGTNTSGVIFGGLVTIANAPVTIHGLSGLHSIAVENQSTANVMSFNAVEQCLFELSGAAAIYQSALSGGAAFISISGGGFGHILNFNDESFISTLDTGTGAIQVTNPAFLNLVVEGNSSFGTNQLKLLSGAFCTALIVGKGGPGYPTLGLQPSAPNLNVFGMQARGTAQIVAGAGKTNPISADADGNPIVIKPNSVITCSQRIANGDGIGGTNRTVRYAALAVDRVNGFPASFRISALTIAGSGATNPNDASTIDWILET
jgi:hypothetical protein